MKLAVLSESAADEAAIRILVEGILGKQTEPAATAPLRTRGWPAVLHVLPAVMKHLHYQTDAEAIVLVVDSNHSPVHQSTHDQPGGADTRCRLCQLQQAADRVRCHLQPVSGRLPLKIALGETVPAIEAWYRGGLDPHVSEAAWLVGLQSGRDPYTKSGLKQAVYGTDRPSLALETQRAVEEARRLAQNLTLIEQPFPSGFGSLARAVRSW